MLFSRSKVSNEETMDPLVLDDAVGSSTVPKKLEKTAPTHLTSDTPLRLVLGKVRPFWPGSQMFGLQMLHDT